MRGVSRRGWCPGLSRPMLTGDGLLVRFLPVDHIAVPAFIGLCDAARRHGNGTIEISARGSVQVRGLTERSAAAFARDVEALAIPAADGMPIVVDPLPEDPNCLVDATSVANKLRSHIARAGLALGPKLCITIDGGGRVHLDALSADVRLRAVSTDTGPRLQVAIAGDANSAIPLGLIRLDEVSETVVRLLATIAEHGPAARARDCIRALRKAGGEIGSDAPYQFSARLPAEPIGVHALRDQKVGLGIAPAFGHAHATAFIDLAHIAGAYGAAALRPAPGRALLLINAARAQVHELAHEASARAARSKSGAWHRPRLWPRARDSFHRVGTHRGGAWRSSATPCSRTRAPAGQCCASSGA